MHGPRPTVVLVFAVLNIVFGSLGLLIAGCGGVLQLFVNRLAASDTARAGVLKDMVDVSEKMKAQVPAYTLVSMISVAVLLGLTILMIVGGIGLLRMKPWARRATILWACLLIIYEFAQTIYQVTLAIPVQMRLQHELMARQGGKGPDLSFGSTFAAVITGVIGLIVVGYAASFLIVLFLPTVRAAFAGEPLASGAGPEDYYDDRAARGGTENG
jgi:hypothetical protein